MAQIQENTGEQKKGKQKKFNIHVDFTPMVDMNMLLITFFMLCTTMSKPQTMEISMPRKDIVDQDKDANKVADTKAITVLLGKDSKVYYYFGKPDYEHPETVTETDFSAEGLRKVLLDRNGNVVGKIKELKQKKENLEISEEQYQTQAAEIRSDKNSPVVMIKATDFSQYKDLIAALDEMQICNIGRYAIVDITPGDLRVLQDLTHEGYTSDLKEVIEYRESNE
jgi:biopolymer transport protein ExbD